MLTSELIGPNGVTTCAVQTRFWVYKVNLITNSVFQYKFKFPDSDRSEMGMGNETDLAEIAKCVDPFCTLKFDDHNNDPFFCVLHCDHWNDNGKFTF